ncbi:asparagine synthase-related protein [Pedomonas mirosovicensis]|uniref:asparagine synthase-related protein n=1 Tax=Pedomonas mirosovicensis TaxID=2908641 RepID=UPI002169BB0B|nr:asparagine synthase C-terminal domain-containing protein [Pedomonas mirosovicensis]MCH8686478.1 asparagine synthase C-terminal domain-containing protein [Pedomonas mirosovicensis]
MYRYCAFIPKPGKAEAAARLIGACAARLAQRRPAYTPVVTTAALTVLEAPGEGTALSAHVLPAGGAVLGTLFENAAATPVGILNEATAKHLAEAGPEKLHRLVWGRYVAFLPGPEGVAVARDPTGGLDCFHVEHHDFHCFFNDAADIVSLGLAPPDINWPHVARHLQMPAKELPDTGLKHVRSLRGGDWLSITRAGVETRTFWRPEEIAARDIPTSVEAAADMLRAAVVQAVRGWGMIYGRILLLLSGGLDSAIVLAALDGAISPDDVLCLNYQSGTADSDERFYARLSCARFKADLMELEERPEAVSLREASKIHFSAQPMLILAQLARSARQAKMARAFEARAVFDGNGGDEIFGSLLHLASATDYLWMHGFNPAFLKMAHEAAQLERVSVWQVARRAVAGVRAHRAPLPSPTMDAHFIAHMRAIFPRFEHDLADMLTRPLPANVPPAKQMQINATALANRHWYPSRPHHDIETVHPLISQPVLEAIYRIPAYMFGLGGRPRGLARHAFRDMVPPQILCRLTKGGINNFTDQIVTRNFGFLRGYFLDGALVREGLLNRQAVEQAFQREGHQSRLMRTTILSALGAESWARQWSAMPPAEPLPAA